MRKIILLFLAITLLLISGCTVRSEADKDLNENQLDAMVSLYVSDELTNSLRVYSDVYNKVNNQGISKVDLSSYKEKISVEINVDIDINVDISYIKDFINLPNWEGPDEYGWYTMYFDLLKKSYIKVRYFSSYRRLEFIVYKDSYITNYAFSKSGYIIFNKDVKKDIAGAYPTELKVSYYILWDSQKGYQNKLGFTLYLDNLNLVTLSMLSGQPKLLEGDFVLYYTHKDYDKNISIDSKEIISAKTDIIGEDTQNPQLNLNGKHITGDIYQSNDYINFDINIPLSSYFN